MDLENQKNETTSSLTEILNSIKLEEAPKINIVNYDFNNINDVMEQKRFDNSEIIGKQKNQEQNLETLSMYQNHNFSQQIQLLSDDTDRRIGNYLLNELEKKQQYIEELEEAVKFQEKEINELKQKLEALSKLELLSKIKSNMDLKLSDIESNLSSVNFNKEKHTELSDVESNKVVQVKKSNQPTQVNKVFKDEEQTQYPRHNPDLVLRRDTEQKVKSISKEEEEPRYNGIMMLDKPKKEEEKIKISLDYDTETIGSSDKMSEIIKQRRRNARF